MVKEVPNVDAMCSNLQAAAEERRTAGSAWEKRVTILTLRRTLDALMLIAVYLRARGAVR